MQHLADKLITVQYFFCCCFFFVIVKEKSTFIYNSKKVLVKRILFESFISRNAALRHFLCVKRKNRLNETVDRRRVTMHQHSIALYFCLKRNSRHVGLCPLLRRFFPPFELAYNAAKL